MERRVEALVVGGGLAGLSAAYFLARRGLRPWVLEREAPFPAPATSPRRPTASSGPGTRTWPPWSGRAWTSFRPSPGWPALTGGGTCTWAALGALAAWALGEEAPAWARAFAPGRFLDPAYRPKEGAARFQL